MSKKEIIYDYNQILSLREQPPDSKIFKNLVGGIHGELEVLQYHKRCNKHTYWFCKCSCGDIISTSTNQLNNGNKFRCSACGRKALSNKMSKGEDYHKNLVITRHKHLIVKSANGSRSSTPWTWWCSECKVDFTISPSNLLSDRYEKGTPCLCDNGIKFVQWTAELREERQILPMCSNTGIRFIGWVDNYSGNKSRIILGCNNDNHLNWESSVNNFVSGRGYGCPDCGIQKRADMARHDATKIASEGKVIHGEKYDYTYFTYVCSRTPSSILCNRCKNPFNQSYDNHINKKKGCPSCAETGYSRDKAGYFYIQSLDDTYIKFGITNISADSRLRKQSSVSIYHHEVIYEWFYDNGHTPPDMETLVKKNFKTKVCSKDNMPEGYTETCDIKDLPKILDLFKDRGYI